MSPSSQRKLRERKTAALLGSCPSLPPPALRGGAAAVATERATAAATDLSQHSAAAAAAACLEVVVEHGAHCREKGREREGEGHVLLLVVLPFLLCVGGGGMGGYFFLCLVLLLFSPWKQERAKERIFGTQRQKQGGRLVRGVWCGTHPCERLRFFLGWHSLFFPCACVCAFHAVCLGVLCLLVVPQHHSPFPPLTTPEQSVLGWVFRFAPSKYLHFRGVQVR